ncbi:hypothetical protein GUJ93_ZPchr0006g44780 [Zizania palustris]|uniref:Uncharacterized protein n=1 Tax=Zizania palustris TaxID=103762 RepID=A0A8J5VQS6_ZIZPA|nr:hypothetical protein GUJ93_ZPchr0006g44780 [Zizania palustris]
MGARPRGHQWTGCPTARRTQPPPIYSFVASDWTPRLPKPPVSRFAYNLGELVWPLILPSGRSAWREVYPNILIMAWSQNAAQKDLRKIGVVLAAKKSLRTAAEGLVAIAQYEKMAVVVELNRETDFVARNIVFQYLQLDHNSNSDSEEDMVEYVEGLLTGSDTKENYKIPSQAS